MPDNSSSKISPKNLLAKYEKLPPSSRFLVNCYAVLGNYLSIQNALSLIGLIINPVVKSFPKNIDLSPLYSLYKPKNYIAFANNLCEQGLLLKSSYNYWAGSKAYCINPKISEPIVQKLVCSDSYQCFVDIIEKIFGQNMSNVTFFHEKTFLCQFRHLIMTKEFSEIKLKAFIKKILDQEYRCPVKIHSFLNAIFADANNADFYSRLPLSILDWQCANLLNKSIIEMTPLSKTFNLLFQIRLARSKKVDNSELFTRYYEYLALRDENFQNSELNAAALIQNQLLPTLLEASRCFFSGNIPKALDLFEIAKDMPHSHGKTTCFPRLFELIHCLCVISANREKSKIWTEVACQNYNTSIRPIDFQERGGTKDSIWLFLLQLHNLPYKTKPLEFSQISNVNIEIPKAFPLLLKAAEIIWKNGINSKKTEAIESLKELQNNPDLALFPWFKKEAADMILTLSDSAKNEKNCSFLAHCITIPDEWEKLKSFVQNYKIKSTSVESVSEDNRSTRLTWRYGKHVLDPYEQTRNCKGVWTSGRKVGLARLYVNWKQWNYLTDGDRKICSKIQMESYYSCGYPKTVYSLKNEAYLGLIGHPFVFSEKNPEQHLEFIQGKPSLKIIKTQNEHRLVIKPFPNFFYNDSNQFMDMEAQYEINLIAPNRYQIVIFEPFHLKIAEILTKKGMAIPKKNIEEIGPFLESVLGDFDIAIDSQASIPLDNMVSIKKTDSDSRIYLHLIPDEESLSLEPLVFPLGENQMSFKPGYGIETIFGEQNGEQIQTTRHFDNELENMQMLFTACPALAKAKKDNLGYFFSDPARALEFLNQLREMTASFVKDPSAQRNEEFIDSFGKKFERESFGENAPFIVKWPYRQKIHVSQTVSFRNMKLCFNKVGDWFQASGEIQVGDHKIKLAELLLALKDSSDRFVRIGEKEYLCLSEEFQKRLNKLRTFTSSDQKEVLIHPLAIPSVENSLNDVAKEFNQFKTDISWKNFQKKYLAAQNKTYKVPTSFKGELREYQEKGFQWLSQLASLGLGACLADDMGLGKTIQAIALLLEQAKNGPALIVAPTSVCANWERELDRFAPSLNPIRISSIAEYGSKEVDRSHLIKKAKARDILITNYSILQIEADTFAKKKFSSIILDEAQAIKNYETGRSKAAFRLQGDFRLATTGTPVENRADDLWSIFHFLNPGFLGDHKSFEARFSAPIAQSETSFQRYDLRQLVRPFILRRLKSAVLDELPPRTDIQLEVDLSDDEAALYEAIRQNALNTLLAPKKNINSGMQHLQILAELTKLRRLCCHPKLVAPSAKISCSKLELFSDTVEELLNNNHKVLVFSQFVDYLKIIGEKLDQMKVSYQYLDGSMSQKKRQKAIDAFQNGESDLFLISLKAGGSGLNLTAADFVIHMDPWWNPAVENQASDRAHRIGQKRPVTVYRMITKGTIEEKIADLHRKKESLARDLLDGTDIPAKLSLEDLMNLFR